MASNEHLGAGISLRPIRLLFLLGCLTFWGIRVYYWSITVEEPFSDMADYVRIAHGILTAFDFGHGAFWQSYKPPTMPLLLAVDFRFFGLDNMIAWRVTQTAFLFVALLLLCRELVQSTRTPWYAVTLIWIVALSKSSIFWSYKPATESMSEAFLYLAAAATSWAVRRRSAVAFGLVGFVYVVTLLLRPQFLPVLPLLLVGLAVWAWFDGRSWRAKSRFAICFLLAAAAVWAPWLVRGMMLYGNPVPVSTQGPYSFLWELGAVTIREPDGSAEKRDVHQLLAEAPQRFDNDYQAMVHANRFVAQWLRDKGRSYPTLIISRAKRSLVEKEIFLTHVSRSELLPPLFNRFLIDKHATLLIAGVLGLLVMATMVPMGFLPVAAISIAQWLMGAAFMGEARLAEPSLPLFLFGNVVWVVLLFRLARHLTAMSMEPPP